jgi:hypothetical protein
MVEPPDSDVFTSLTNLMQFITRETDHQFITFVDSRKQTEHMASMMRRNLEPDSRCGRNPNIDRLERLHVRPFSVQVTKATAVNAYRKDYTGAQCEV